MIHTTYRTIIEKSDVYTDIDTNLSQLEKTTGSKEEYGLDMPIAMSTILAEFGPQTTILFLEKVTDGESQKSIKLCEKIIPEIVAKTCELIGKKPFEFDWHDDFTEADPGIKLAAFWANESCNVLAQINSLEITNKQTIVIFAHCFASLLSKAVQAVHLQDKAEQHKCNQYLYTLVANCLETT